MKKSLLLLLMMFVCITNANANLSQQMDNLFGSMINVTPGQAYMGQQAGSLSPGSMVVRNKIKNAQLLGFVAPHISAGCGGIDIFGGSFSFINAAQFEQLLRSVASNATGYFFELALSAMCPQCMSLMADLQAKIQKLNSALGNSCAIAKSAVSAATLAIPGVENAAEDSYLGRVRKKAQADYTANSAVFTDAISAANPFNNENTAASIINAQGPTSLQTKKLTGNILWERLQDSNADAWFVVGGDQKNREVIMSLLGTIEMKTVDSTDNTGAATKSFKTDSWPSTITFKEFLKGATAANVYSCAADPTHCRSTVPQGGVGVGTNKVTVPTNIIGMEDRVRAILYGNPGNAKLPNLNSIGMIEKYRLGTNVQWSADEIHFVEHTSVPVVAMLRALSGSSNDVGAMNLFANKIIPVLAIDMIEQLINEYIETASKSMVDADTNQSDSANRFLQKLQARKQELREEVQSQKLRIDQVQSAIVMYTKLLSIAPKNMKAMRQNNNAIKVHK